MENDADFYIDDHAVLYALLVREAFALGEAGQEAAVLATTLYGRERGLRMAMRCMADGRPLTLRNYLRYGEWADSRQWPEFRPAGWKPFVLEAWRCGWRASWLTYGLEEYGRVFCRWIDPSLVRGFNPDAAFSLEGSLSEGAERCRFVFHGAEYDGEEDWRRDMDERTQAAPRRVRSFLYHAGHVLSAMRRVFLPKFGLPRGGNLLEGALCEYASLFGPHKRRLVEEESRRDFLACP